MDAMPDYGTVEVGFRDDLLPETIATRKIGRLERLLGPENYRVISGLLSTPTSVAGLILIALFVFVALAAPVLAPPVRANDPYQIPRDGFGPEPRPMGAEWSRNVPEVPFWYRPLTGNEEWVHLLGTTSGQWDIYYGIIWGTRTAFKSGLLITFSTLLIGVLIGSVAAYYGGWVDNVLMRIVDIFMTLPFILVALIMAAVLTPKLGRTIMPAVISLIAFGWMAYARLIRGDILAVRERDYVLAAKVVGVKDRSILLKHILPNAVFPTLVIASMDIGTYVITFAALSFLGVGTDIGYADWGQLLAFGRDWINNLSQYWYIVFWPGMALVFFVLGWNLVGDALRDVLDPKLRGQS